MIIWITGTSTGIGEAVAQQFVERGHTVFGTARSPDTLDALSKRLRGADGAFHPIAADVTDADAMRDAYTTIKQDAGVPDLVIFNAGTYYPTPAQICRTADHRQMMEVNYFGVLNGLELVLPDFIDRQGGQIAIVSSLAGYRGLPTSSAYGASKAALINLCESLQPELIGASVDLRLINPGFVETPLTDQNSFPMPFLVSTDIAAQRIISGLAGQRFETAFPRRFAWVMKTLRLLPNTLFLRLMRRLVPGDPVSRPGPQP